jgi:hypothetical protein
MATAESPVFLFVAGLGAGGWALQHAVSASRQILLWRAAPGALNHFLEGLRLLDLAESGMNPGWLGGASKTPKKRLKPGDDVLPYVGSLSIPASQARRHVHGLITGLYGARAGRFGFQTWGLYDPTADKLTLDLLRTVFPQARFVFLVRHPLACVEAARRAGQTFRDRWGERGAEVTLAEGIAREWVSRVRQFEGLPHVRSFRFEDLQSQPSVRSALEAFLGLPEPLTLDDTRPDPAASRDGLPPDEVSRLWPLVKEAAALWGYDSPETGAPG